MAWIIVDLQIEPGDVCNAVLSNGTFEVEVLFVIVLENRMAVARGLHIQGPGQNNLGLAKMRAIAWFVMEKLDVDELSIEGAARTSGAGPGRTPTPIVFRRRRDVGPPT